MKKIFSILFTLGIFATLFSCKNESPFSVEVEDGAGRFITSSLSIEVKPEVMTSRATQLPSVDDFTVVFVKTSSPYEAFMTFKYNSLPEVVTLPVGEYKVKAYYGDDNIVAKFDSPAYYGESDVISITNGKIVDIKDPIVCTLYNVRVAVSFDPELLAVMGDDAKVSVKVGESGELVFDKNTDSDGFFKYDENSNTLAATFTGTVNDAFITEQKNYDNVKRGTYYKITFKLRSVDTGAEQPGNVVGNGTIIVDATVTFHDHSSEGGMNVDPDSEEYLEDDRYPGQNQKPGEDPNQPEDPDKDGLPQLVSDDVDINAVTDIYGWEENKPLAVKILTPTQLTEFVCYIKSTYLTEDELKQVNLKPDLDLINDTDYFEDLSQLGFPVGDEITNPEIYEDGNYVIIFDITKFVPLLNIAPGNTHNFEFHLTNATGSVVKTLKLKN